MTEPLTAPQVIDACTALGVKLRINPDKRLSAINAKKLTEGLRHDLRRLRSEIYELIEDRDGLAELTIEELPVVEPPVPTRAELIVARAAAQGIEISLDEPTPWGRLKCVTPWIKLPDMASRIALPDADVKRLEAMQQRAQVPQALAAEIENHRAELLEHFRARYRPPVEPPPPDATPIARSIWERIARPDNTLPNMQDNQARVKALLFGDAVIDPVALQRQAALNRALPQKMNAAIVAVPGKRK